MTRVEIARLIRKVTRKILRFIESNTIDDRIFSLDMEKGFREIYKKCKFFTVTSLARMYSLYKSIEYIVNNKIPGDIVECGVWKGGSMMLCALTLIKMNEKKRKLYLYDTYEGMTEPTENDVRNLDKKLASEIMKKFDKKKSKYYYAPLPEVKENLYSTGYPKNNLIFIKGKVEDTIPNTIPERISVLRLDTDWYESTYHELNYLFPRLEEKGILIIDDYGFWTGSKKATDNYIKENNLKCYLNRIDATGRLVIK